MGIPIIRIWNVHSICTFPNILNVQWECTLLGSIRNVHTIQMDIPIIHIWNVHSECTFPNVLNVQLECTLLSIFEMFIRNVYLYTHSEAALAKVSKTSFTIIKPFRKQWSESKNAKGEPPAPRAGGKFQYGIGRSCFLAGFTNREDFRDVRM